MTTKTERQTAWIQLKVTLAAALINYGYRLLGATKEHAWNRAKVDVANAIMDKTVEKVGIIDPRHKGKPGVQVFFEGGSIAGESRFVDDCGGVLVKQEIPSDDPRQHFYKRTDRKRGQQTVYAYVGLVMPSDRVSAIAA